MRADTYSYMQIVKPDIRVYQLVEELSSGPLPDWNPLPTTLILNKVRPLARMCRKYIISDVLHVHHLELDSRV